MSEEYIRYRNAQLKIFMKEGRYRYYCIGYKKAEEIEIISRLTAHTTNCVLLESKYEVRVVSDAEIMYCDRGSIDETIGYIFENKGQSGARKRKAEMGKDVGYVLFARVNVFPSSLELDEHTKSNRFVDDYLFHSYTAMLEKFYKVVEVFVYRKGGESRGLLRFVDKDSPKEYIFDDLIVILWAGLGDFFMIHSLQYEFLLRKREQYENIYVPISNYPYSNRYSNLKLIHGSTIEKLIFDNDKMCGYLENKLTDKRVSISKKGEEWKDKHIYDIWKAGLNICEDMSPYKYDYVLKEIVMSTMPAEEKEMIDRLLGQNEVVGLQPYSGFFHASNGMWETREVRNWDSENTEKFVELCSQNGVNVIILTPNPYERLRKHPHLPEVSTSGYIYAISKLRLLVGIDSSAGHIASFYDIPSITIWGGTNPLRTEAEIAPNVGFRVLRNNIGVVSRSRSTKDIDYRRVYDILSDTLMNGIADAGRIISYDDSINDFNIIYTG